jgi:hypothetical protein
VVVGWGWVELGVHSNGRCARESQWQSNDSERAELKDTWPNGVISIFLGLGISMFLGFLIISRESICEKLSINSRQLRGSSVE